MKTRIAILGSTGSIGRSLLKIITKENHKFKILLLTADKNYKLIIKQAVKFKVNNIIITNKKYFNLAKSLNISKRINIFNNFENLNKIFKKKADYVMSSIVGLDGLTPTFKIIKHTKKIAIANKESIICGWNLIKKELEKYNTEFIPVDSEHFSVWYGLDNHPIKNIEKIYLTASGGPLLNVPYNKFNKLKIRQILKHPNWNMGSKISVDSSTMMNKIFEIIEAKKIFNLNYNQLSIFIHPESYIHGIIKFNDGMIKLIAHETTMDIPILNTLSSTQKINFKSKEINLSKLNNLKLSKINKKKFPLIKILNKLPNKESLFETVIVAINDHLVRLFLNKKITYLELIKNLFKLLLNNEFNKYKFIEPKKITDIYSLNNLIKSQINQNLNND